MNRNFLNSVNQVTRLEIRALVVIPGRASLGLEALLRRLRVGQELVHGGVLRHRHRRRPRRSEVGGVPRASALKLPLLEEVK